MWRERREVRMWWRSSWRKRGVMLPPFLARLIWESRSVSVVAEWKAAWEWLRYLPSQERSMSKGLT